MLAYCWNITCKLESDAGCESPCMPNVAAAFGEEEAGPQAPSIVEPASDGPCDRGLPSTSEAVQPVQTSLVLYIGPTVYLF